MMRLVSIAMGSILALLGVACGDDGAGAADGGTSGSGATGSGGEGSGATATGGTATGGMAGPGGEGQGGEATGGESAGGQGTGGIGGGGDRCAACPDSCCDGTCVDLTTTPAHCGMCGHDCESGGCAGSVCLPGVVGQGALVGLDDDEVFLILGGAAARYPKAGGAGTAIGTLSGAIQKVSLGATGIYATTLGNAGDVLRLDLTTGAASTVALDEDNPTYPLEVGSFVYWGTTGGLVRRAPTGGGTVVNFANGGIPFELKSDGTKIFFTDTLEQSLHRVDLNGTVGVEDNVPSAFRMVVDGTQIFLTGDGVIYSTLASGFGGGIQLALDLPNNQPIHCLARDQGATLVGTAEGLRRGTDLIVPGGAVSEVYADAERVYFTQAGTTYKIVK